MKFLILPIVIGATVGLLMSVAFINLADSRNEAANLRKQAWFENCLEVNSSGDCAALWLGATEKSLRKANGVKE